MNYHEEIFEEMNRRVEEKIRKMEGEINGEAMLDRWKHQSMEFINETKNAIQKIISHIEPEHAYRILHEVIQCLPRNRLSSEQEFEYNRMMEKMMEFKIPQLRKFPPERDFIEENEFEIK